MIRGLSPLIEQIEIVEREGKSIVVKRYGSVPGILKWLIVTVPPIAMYYPLETSPTTRMIREETFLRKPPKNITVPKILSIDYLNLVMEREYVEGRHPVLQSTDDLSRIGEALGLIHAQDYCLGDTRIENFLLTPQGTVCIVDAEQSLTDCNKQTYKMWDLLLLLVFLLLEDPVQGRISYRERVKTILEAYTKQWNVSWDVMKSIKPLLILLPLPYLTILKDEVVVLQKR